MHVIDGLLSVCISNFLVRSQFIYFSNFFLHQMTALHLAAESGHIKILNYLVDQGANINIWDDNRVSICDNIYKCCSR